MADPTEADVRATLRNKLVVLLGSNGTGVTTTLLDSAIDTALDDMSRLKPKVSYVVMDMVAGQAVYTVPTGTYKVLDVVFPDPGGLADAELAYSLDGMPPMNHSLAIIEAQMWEQFQNLYGFDWEYNADAGTVTVMPTPTTSGKMALKVSELRTLLDLPVSMSKAAESLALAAVLSDMTASVGGGITSVPIGIGSVSFDPSRLVVQAERLRKEAYSKLGLGGGQVIVG